jgi:hypothetical protein
MSFSLTGVMMPGRSQSLFKHEVFLDGHTNRRNSLQHLPILFVPLILVAGILSWFVVSTMLRSLSGMEKGVPTPLSTPLKESGWGSAKINAVSWRNAIKLVEYKDGWLIRAMPIFGGEAIWMPRDSAIIISGCLVSLLNSLSRTKGHLRRPPEML